MWSKEEVIPLTLEIDLGDGNVFKLAEQNADSEILMEFNCDMQQLSKDLEDLPEIFKDIDHQIEKQGENIPKIEEKIVNSQDKVDEAFLELADAERSKANNRVLKLGIIGASVGGALGGSVGVIGGAIGGTFILPVGGTVGVAAAAGAGGLAGGAVLGGGLMSGIGAVIQKHENNVIDNKIVYHANAKKWVPDDYSDKCMNENCNQKLGKLRLAPRHHCRLCGLLFCGKHCRHYVFIKYTGMENSQKQLICVDCKEKVLKLRDIAAEKCKSKET